jgi:CHAD domain-containing protein
MNQHKTGRVQIKAETTPAAGNRCEIHLDPNAFSSAHLRTMADHLYRRLSLMRGYLLSAHPDPNARTIHDLRVATRRTTEAIAILAAAGSISSPTAGHCIRLLRQLRRSAGSLRDVDVCIDQLRPSGSHPMPRRIPRREPLLQSLRTKRSKAAKLLNRQWLLAAADPLLHQIVDRTRSLDMHLKPAAVEFAFQQRLEFHRRRFARRARRAGSRMTPHHIHRTRIAGKQWRYFLELVRDIRAADSAVVDDALQRLKHFQKAAGELQDSVAVQSHLKADSDAKPWPPMIRRQLAAAIRAMKSVQSID